MKDSEGISIERMLTFGCSIFSVTENTLSYNADENKNEARRHM